MLVVLMVYRPSFRIFPHVNLNTNSVYSAETWVVVECGEAASYLVTRFAYGLSAFICNTIRLP
jgi:hypothetical protein